MEPGPHDGALMSAEGELDAGGGRSWPRLLGSFALTVWFIVTVNFFLPRALPGDPITLLESQGPNLQPDAEVRAALEEYYGFDRPLVVQYVGYLGNLAQGDLGTSVSNRAPVLARIMGRLPWTLVLMGTATVLATAAGLIAGVESGWRGGRRLDRGLLGVLLTVREFPPFLLASFAILVFSVKLDWFPPAGGRDPSSGPSGLLAVLADLANHLVLPALVLTVGMAVGHYLVMRATMISELGSDHLLLGRAKGLRQRRLKYRYAARNAALPVVSFAALQIGFLVTGAIFIETIFSYPGIGQLVTSAVQARDYPLMQGCFLVIGLFVVSANTLGDAVNRRLDPRIST
ncbi:MAG: ABC transporter permease [Acidimicrobiales bacterium]